MAKVKLTITETKCRCGYKFGRWYNMIWIEKIIGEHHSDMNTVSAMMS